MSYAIWSHCQRCGTLPKFVPVYGGFIWHCECPLPEATTSNGTGQIVIEQTVRVGEIGKK